MRAHGSGWGLYFMIQVLFIGNLRDLEFHPRKELHQLSAIVSTHWLASTGGLMPAATCIVLVLPGMHNLIDISYLLSY